jgi:hypothetical protein
MFSNTYVLRTAQQELVELKMFAVRERAEFQHQGMSYSLYRERAMSGDFLLEHNGRAAARAQKPSALRQRFNLEIDGQRFELRRAGVFSRRYEIRSNDRLVGAVERVHAWGGAHAWICPPNGRYPFSSLCSGWLHLCGTATMPRRPAAEPLNGRSAAQPPGKSSHHCSLNVIGIQ